MKFREPDEHEVRPSGFALYATLSGYVERVPSCQRCARTVGVSWQPALFEGVCRGCEVILSGFADE